MQKFTAYNYPVIQPTINYVPLDKQVMQSDELDYALYQRSPLENSTGNELGEADVKDSSMTVTNSS